MRHDRQSGRWMMNPTQVPALCLPAQFCDKQLKRKSSIISSVRVRQDDRLC